MRPIMIDFTGADAPVDFFAGYKGEANNTQLTICLPKNLCSEDIDYYRAHFKTVGYENISSEKLYAIDGVIMLTLWYELLRSSGNLLMQISAYDFAGNELIRLGKTPIVTLKVRPSLPAGVEGNIEVHGMEAELEELMRLHYSGDCSVMVNTFTDLPTPVKQGTLALVRNPPPRYVRQCVRPIIKTTNYPRLYINPYPPRPEHVYTGDDSFAEAYFVKQSDNGYESEPTLYFITFDGTDEGLPIMLQIVPKFSENQPMYVYAWDEFYLGEELHILPGWYKAFINFETGELITIEPIEVEEIPVVEYAGRNDSSSVYLGYYLSPDPYFKEVLDSMYIFDGDEWKLMDAEDTSIKPIGMIPVRGIDFPEDGYNCSLGVLQETAKAVTYPSFATNRSIVYTISDDTMLSLSWQTDDDDKLVLFITGLKAGTTTLTATTEDGGFTKSRMITIQEV